MHVKIWGSRGSTPVSGAEFKSYGTDTSCVEVRTNAGHTILLDAGTGLGAYARNHKELEEKTPFICLSHLHIDHIQGLPYYRPLYTDSITVYGPALEDGSSLGNGLGRMFDGILLPIRLADLPKLHLIEVKPKDKFNIGDALVETFPARHPGGSLAWKICADGQTLVYSGDHEIPLDSDDAAALSESEAFFNFMAGADLAIVDAHFTASDHARHQGWGHSHFEQWPAALSGRGVKKLLFYHFNPDYDDAALDAILARVRKKYPDQDIQAAYAGYTWSQESETTLPVHADACPVCDFFQQAATLSDTHSVLDSLLTKARKLTNADAGTIYLIENDELSFAASQNDTLFPKSAANKFAYMSTRIPINRSSIAGFVAATGATLNLPDVYKLNKDCEFSFNQALDKKNGYRTSSVLCVPLINSRQKIIGVLQLINALVDGEAAPFSQHMENSISHLASMATIPLERSLMLTNIILRMLQTSALRDPKETAAHVYRVGSISAELFHHWADKHGMDPEEILATKSRLRLAAMLHDVGKVGIPDAVLKKPGRLDDEERSIMQRHSALGASLFADSLSDIDSMARNIALHHHAKWDGSGYTGSKEIPSPSGRQIPLEARITAIADVYDALVSRRCYKDAWDNSRAVEVLNKDAGSHFDPELVICFDEIMDTVQAIINRYHDKTD